LPPARIENYKSIRYNCSTIVITFYVCFVFYERRYREIWHICYVLLVQSHDSLSTIANSQLCWRSAVQDGIIKSLLAKKNSVESFRRKVLSPNTSDLMTCCVNQTLRLPPLARRSPFRFPFHSRLHFLSISVSLSISLFRSSALAAAAAACSSFSPFFSSPSSPLSLILSRKEVVVPLWKQATTTTSHLHRHLVQGRSPPVIHDVSHGDNYHQIHETWVGRQAD